MFYAKRTCSNFSKLNCCEDIKKTRGKTINDQYKNETKNDGVLMTVLLGGAENGGPENAGPENAGPNVTT